MRANFPRMKFGSRPGRGRPVEVGGQIAVSVEVDALLRGGQVGEHLGPIQGADFGPKEAIGGGVEHVVRGVVTVGPHRQLRIVIHILVGEGIQPVTAEGSPLVDTATHS